MLYAISAHLKSYPAPALEKRADSVPEIFGLLVLAQAMNDRPEEE